MASSFFPAKGVTQAAVAEAALLASLADETPEGRSIVNLARRDYAVKAASVQEIGGRFVPFSAKTRMSGLDFDDERRRIRKGAAEAVKEWVIAARRQISAGSGHRGEEDFRGGRDAAGRCPRQRGPRGSLPQGRGQGRHQGPPVSPAADGDPLHHDHGRQPPDCRHYRRGSGSGRLHRGGHSASQAGAHPRGAEERPPGGHDRGRHERRPCPRPGRRGSGHELGHAGGSRSGQHGGPGLQPDQAHRHRGGGQGAAHHPGGAHDVQHRERRGEVLRDPPGHVRGAVRRQRRSDRCGR